MQVKSEMEVWIPLSKNVIGKQKTKIEGRISFSNVTRKMKRDFWFPFSDVLVNWLLKMEFKARIQFFDAVGKRKTENENGSSNSTFRF